MKISSYNIKKIIEISKIQDIFTERILNFYLTLATGTKTVIKTVIEEMNFSEEEIQDYSRLLLKEKIISEKDLEFLNQSMKIKQTVNQNKFEKEIEEVVNHFNEVTKKRIRVTDKRKSLIKSKFMEGFSVYDFKCVNIYYYNLWKDNPQMEKYITPDTLYNSKFANRVETARTKIETIKQYKNEIMKIYLNFKYFYEEYVNRGKNIQTVNGLIENKENFINEFKKIDFKTKELIVFWLTKGISVEDIILTIQFSIKAWSKKQELIPYITIEKILDSKFVERLHNAKKINSVIQQNSNCSFIGIGNSQMITDKKKDSLETLFQWKKKKKED